jgi:RNA polymerase sigma factor (sigma-70 family)
VEAFAQPQTARDLARDEAFERLYRRYARDVYRYTLALLRNPADAEDITQTTFLNAYRAYLRGEEPIRPRNWLIKIAHNACRSRHLRAVRRPQEVPLEETVAALRVPAQEAPKVEELLNALGRLPFNQRAALVMRELEGRSYVEIAQTLDVSVAAVETLIFRARRTLRKDRSLFGALGAVQLPPSLTSLVGGGGGGAAAVAGSGLAAKAALLVAAGLIAGTVGTTVESKLGARSPKSAAVLAPPPLLVREPALRVPAQVEVTRRKATERGTALRSAPSSSTRASRAVQPVFGGATGSSHQSSPAQGGLAEAGTGTGGPAASAPTATTEAPSSSSSSPTSSPVSSAVDDVTLVAPPPPSVEAPPLPPVPPPPALPVATPSLPEPPATPSLPPPPALPSLP